MEQSPREWAGVIQLSRRDTRISHAICVPDAQCLTVLLSNYSDLIVYLGYSLWRKMLLMVPYVRGRRWPPKSNGHGHEKPWPLQSASSVRYEIQDPTIIGKFGRLDRMQHCLLLGDEGFHLLEPRGKLPLGITTKSRDPKSNCFCRRLCDFLHSLVENDQKDVVSILHSSKVVEWKNCDGILSSALSGTPGMLRVLLRCGVVLGSPRNPYGDGPLHQAILQGSSLDMLKVLILEGKADPNGLDKEGRPPIDFALNRANDCRGNLPAAQLLLDLGANVADAVGGCWHRPLLHFATMNNSIEVARFLIEKGDVSVQSDIGETALLRAVESGNTEMVELLLRAGAPKQAPLLSLAVANRRYSTIIALMGEGSSELDGEDAYGQTPLDIVAAKRENRPRTASLLIREGACCTRRLNNAEGRTILHVAVQRSWWHVVKVILTKYPQDPSVVNVLDQTRDQMTPLQIAASQGNRKIASLLIKLGGADVEARSGKGWTALHYAAKKSSTGVARVLIEEGHATVDSVTNDEGRSTPRSLAYSDKRKSCFIEMLTEAGK